jgi:tol-pal system protein YbgF
MSTELKVILIVLIVLLIIGGAGTAVWLLFNTRTDQVLARAEEKYRLGDVSDIKEGIETYTALFQNRQTPADVAAEALYRSAEGYVLLWQKTRDPSRLVVAQERLKAVGEKYPLSAQARKALLLEARVNFLQDNYDTALAELDDVISKFSDPYVITEALNQKGEIYYAIGDYEKSVGSYSRKENMNSEQAVLGRARAFLKMGLTEKAIDLYADFLKYNPQSPYAKDVRATVLDVMYNYAFNMYQSRDQRTAVRYFDMITELFPDDPKAENALYWIGECYYDRKDYDGAIASFGEVIDHRSSAAKDPDALFKLGMCWFELKDYYKSLKYFEMLLDQFPENRLASKAQTWKDQAIREIKYE